MSKLNRIKDDEVPSTDVEVNEQSFVDLQSVISVDETLQPPPKSQNVTSQESISEEEATPSQNPLNVVIPTASGGSLAARGGSTDDLATASDSAERLKDVDSAMTFGDPGVETDANTNIASVSGESDGDHIASAHLVTPVPAASMEAITYVKSTEDNEADATATAKFELQPSKHVVTASVTIGQQIERVAEQLVSKVSVPLEFLTFSHEGTTLQKDITFQQLNVKPNSIITLHVTSLDPAKHPIKIPSKESSTPDVITVRVPKDRDNTAFKEVVVTVEKSAKKKPFIGGYKHKVTGKQYHNASAQTNPKPPRIPKTTLFDRDCQTVFERKKETQTTNTTSTQMTVPGCEMSVFEDKVIEAKPYFDSRHFRKRRLEAVVVIQRYWRRWLAWQYCDRLRKARDERLEWERCEEIRKRKEKEARIKKEFERRMKPKTKEDFDLVYAALEKWRVEEVSNIEAEMLDEPTRKAALCALLEQETQLIASIGKHKNEADKVNRAESIQKLLDKAAAPKRWKAYDGRYTEMDTKYTIRAKELRDIYKSITMKYLTQDERLDVLLTLKHTVKEHDCKLTREIIELIDREADLIMRGVSDTNLEGLRQRIATQFLEYCKNPMFNPEIARYTKVPQDPTTLETYFCTATNSYLPSTEFTIDTKSRNQGQSRKAIELDNIGRTRRDYSVYRTMLRSIRSKETTMLDNAKTAFLIQEKDLQYLVDNIWKKMSIFSSWDDVSDLEFARWNKYEQWSPWNCILVTKDEAIAHLRVDHLAESYGTVFMNKIRDKHTVARIYFSKLPGMSEQLRKKSKKMPGPQELCGKSVLQSR